VKGIKIRSRFVGNIWSVQKGIEFVKQGVNKPAQVTDGSGAV
jgi:hypothetical protein